MTDYTNRRQKVVLKVLQTVGNSEVVDSSTVTVVSRDGAGDVTEAKGTTVPADAQSGFAKGCVFVDTDVATGISGVYENIGTNISANFDVVGSALPAGSIGATEVEDSAGVAGHFIKKSAVVVYDFAVDGGVVGAIVPASVVTLPDNALVTSSSYEVMTTLTSAGDTATIVLSVPTDGALDTAVAINDASNPWDAGGHVANTPLPKKLTAARALGMTIGVENITAGKVVFTVDYLVMQ